jgi:transposase
LIKSTVFDVIADKRSEIITDIKRYRYACNKVNAVCYLAEIAGATIKEGDNGFSIKPGASNAAKNILAETFGIHDKKAHLYETRLWIRSLNPTWLSIVPEAIHIDVSNVWKAKDPEFVKASRGYLQIQGARRLTKFDGIGISIKNTVPKLKDHSVFVKWDSVMGEVELRLGKLDGSRYHIWNSLRDKVEGWKLGSMRLTERDGFLKLIVSYTLPDLPKAVDVDKAMYVEFGETPENFITMHTDKNYESDVISIAGTIEWVKQLEAIRIKYEAERKSYGRNKGQWGNRNGWKAVIKKSEALTLRRTNGEKDHNHCWTKRIVQNAIRWNAGAVVVVNMPERTMLDYPWSWYQFKQMLKYKIEEIGGSLNVCIVEKEKVA